MTEPEFLEPDVVLFLHDQALREYGGIQDVKSEHMLHRALNRPVGKLTDADANNLDLLNLAAAYVYRLSSNHPFNDSNERTAWSSCVLFLRANSVEIALLAQDAVEQMVRPAIGTINEHGFVAWLRTSRRGDGFHAG